MKTFRIGINMAGAISAGAYTAGVLDFLTEALDAWYAAKETDQEVPRHNVSIDVFSGASAGGMCAAISAVLLQDDIQHISDTSATGTTNRLYESWVNQIDIRKLLQQADLKNKGPVVSLLDATVIDTIADYALSPGVPRAEPRAYLSPDLTLFLSLTNLRGVVYSLNGVAPGSVEETAFFYGDRIRFQTVSSKSLKALAAGAYPIDLTSKDPDWSQLRNAAKATGAFPVFLAPRPLWRRKSDFTPPPWESFEADARDEPPPVQPSFPSDLPELFQTLNVDGGVTNNDPFLYAHDFLAKLAPAAVNQTLETDPCKADRAVLTIAPFPTTKTFTTRYDLQKNSWVLRALPHLFTALIAQSRFFGESLTHLMGGASFSHFVIAPSDDELVRKDEQYVAEKDVPEALQCATLGAFGGFLERGFRAHDYALGRRNCQKFLLAHFVLPEDNAVMEEALGALATDARVRILRDFGRTCPMGPDGKPLTFPSDSCVKAGTKWLPIVPLCSPELRQPVPLAQRAKMRGKDLEAVVDLISKRFRAVAAVLIRSIRYWPLRFFLKPGPWFIAFFGRNLVKQALIEQLGDSYEQDQRG